MSSPNPNPTEGYKHNSAAVPYLESYFPKCSHDPRFAWDEQILIGQETALLRDGSRINGGC
jgi:hypothetical protein